MRRAWMMLATIILLVLAGISAFIYAGVFEIGADMPHWSATEKLMETVRERSIASRSENIQVPVNLNDPQLVLKGAGQYAEMCVNCHLAPGIADSEMRRGLYPQPPALAQTRIDPRVAFWVTKHGIKMTAMPAWGVGHDDATIWSIVAFLNQLPTLTPQQYRDLVNRAPADEEMRAGEAVQAGTEAHAHGSKDASSKAMPAMPGMR